MCHTAMTVQIHTWIKGCDVAALTGYESALKKEQVQDVPLSPFVFA